MSDLFRGQTCTELYKFVSGGVAHTFTFNFQADKAVFVNLTAWETTSSLPVNIWYRDETTAAHSYAQRVIVDSGVTGSKNFADISSNGFTEANTSGGQSSSFANISAVSQADPCVVTTSSAHGFQTNQIVMITDLGNVGSGVAARGMNQLNNNRYRIVVVDSTSFSLKDINTDEAIDSSSFTAYVSGGRVTLESHVLTLNNPQVSPYSDSNPYNPNPYAYDPVEYKLTAGTSVMGSDGDQFLIEVYKFGNVVELGDLGA